LNCLVWRIEREDEFAILMVLMAEPPLFFIRRNSSEGVTTYYSARAIAVPLLKMAELTFPLSVVTLESRSSVPSKVVWKDAKVEIFGVGFPSSPQNRMLE